MNRPGYYLGPVIDKDEFQGHTITGNFTYPSNTVETLLKSLDKRYSDVSEDVLGATKIASLTSWPVEFNPGVCIH